MDCGQMDQYVVKPVQLNVHGETSGAALGWQSLGHFPTQHSDSKELRSIALHFWGHHLSVLLHRRLASRNSPMPSLCPMHAHSTRLPKRREGSAPNTHRRVSGHPKGEESHVHMGPVSLLFLH